MLTSPSGGRYIGMTTVSMRKRFWRHVTDANNRVNTNIALAICKYGKEAIKTEVLVECADRDTLRIMEENAIRVYGTNKGRDYNINTRWNHAPDTTGYKHTAEAKARIADHMRNRTVSAKTRINMSKANTGKKLSTEHRVKLSKAHTGVPWTTAQRDSRRVRNG